MNLVRRVVARVPWIQPSDGNSDVQPLELNGSKVKRRLRQTGEPGAGVEGIDRDERLDVRPSVMPQSQPGSRDAGTRNDRRLERLQRHLAGEPLVERVYDAVPHLR